MDLPRSNVCDDLFHLFLFHRAPVDLYVDFDKSIDRFCAVVRFHGMLSVYAAPDPCRIVKAVLELVHAAEAGAGSEGNEDGGIAHESFSAVPPRRSG